MIYGVGSPVNKKPLLPDQVHLVAATAPRITGVVVKGSSYTGIDYQKHPNKPNTNKVVVIVEGIARGQLPRIWVDVKEDLDIRSNFRGYIIYIKFRVIKGNHF